MTTANPPKHTEFRDLLETSWIRTSLKLCIIFTVAAIVFIWLLKIFNFAASPLFGSLNTFFLHNGLAGIFLATILAGTIIPLGSPALVAAAAMFGIDPIQIVLVATIGFTTGMSVNYALAYKLGRPFVTKRVPADRMDDIFQAWNKWGKALYIAFGLLPFLPVELLAFFCGILKMKPITFLLISFIPRLIVFTFIAYFGQQIGSWLTT